MTFNLFLQQRWLELLDIFTDISNNICPYPYLPSLLAQGQFQLFLKQIPSNNSALSGTPCIIFMVAYRRRRYKCTFFKTESMSRSRVKW